MESNLLESNYGPEYEYVSFFAIEYEYIYPVGEVKLSPIFIAEYAKLHDLTNALKDSSENLNAILVDTFYALHNLDDLSDMGIKNVGVVPSPATHGVIMQVTGWSIFTIGYPLFIPISVYLICISMSLCSVCIAQL